MHPWLRDLTQFSYLPQQHVISLIIGYSRYWTLLRRVEYCIREFALLTINDTMIVLFHDCCYSTRAERDPNKRPLYALLINEKQTTANSALLSSVIINKRQRQQIAAKLQKDYKTLLLDIILNKRCSCPLKRGHNNAETV